MNIGATYGMGVLVAGDVNEDGKQDLITSSIGGLQPTYVLLGNGDGRFTQAALVPGSFTAGRLVDVNGDGHLDLVGVYVTAQAPSVALGDGKGNFTAVSLTPPAIGQGQPGAWTAIVTGDFNRDGAVDLVAAFSTDQAMATRALYFYAGTGKNTFLAPKTIANTTTDYSHGTLATADFDADGKLDLLDGSAVLASIFPGYGDGTFDLGATAHSVYFPVAAASNFVTVATEDLNADTFADILVGVPTDNVLYGFLNEGKGNFYQNTAEFSAPLAGRPGILLTADLNGDGLPDAVATDITRQNISYFLSVRPRATAAVALTGSTSQVLAGGSVTVMASVTGTVQANFAKARPTGSVTLTEGAQSLGQAPLDGNGNATFTVPSLAAGTHTLALNYTGDGNFLAASGAGSVAVAVADVVPALPTPSQTIAAGGTATYSLTLTPVANFAGTATFTCSGLPTGYACSSAPVALNGQPAGATVRVVAGSATLYGRPDPFGTAPRGLVLAATLVLAVGTVSNRRQWTGALLCVAGTVLVATVVSGCAGSSSSSGGATTSTPPATQPTTPTVPAYRGTTNFTITTTLTQGSQSLSHTTGATLIVQ